MRRLFVFALLLMGAAGCATLPNGPAVSQAAPIYDDETLLVLTARAPEPLIAQAEGLGYILTRQDALPSLGETMVHLRIPTGTSIPEAIAEIEAIDPTVTAGANHAYALQLSKSELSFAHQAIGWPERGCVARRSVGLIDAGVPPDDPALMSGRIEQAVLHTADEPPRTDHGAKMAALLVGEGRLTGTTLYSANVIDPRVGRGDRTGVDAILRAVEWLKASEVEVVNMSLAGPFNKLLNRALGTAAQQGMIIVAAAGNQGPDAPPQYPAAFPFVVAVTAVDRGFQVYRNAVQGDHVDIAAPGVDIVLDVAGRPRVATGTSAAAPYVTAVLAAEPRERGRTVEMARTYLQTNARDLGDVGRDRVYGAGLVAAPSGC